MSYLELYIESNSTQDLVTSGINSTYWLPGLIDCHSTSSASEAELQEWKKEYNKWLGVVRSHIETLSVDDTLTDREKGTIRSNLEHWSELMYELLRKIGRYSNREVEKGFIIE